MPVACGEAVPAPQVSSHVRFAVRQGVFREGRSPGELKFRFVLNPARKAR